MNSNNLFLKISISLILLLIISCDDSNSTETSNPKSDLDYLFINELQADNETGITDESGNFEDWIEIFNSSDSTISLGGLYLSDNNDEWVFPFSDSTVIPPNGFLIIWTDKDDIEGVLHTNFKLSKSGEKVTLYSIENNIKNIIDEVIFDSLGTDKSYGRVTDGNTEMKVFDKPSPGQSNNSQIE